MSDVGTRSRPHCKLPLESERLDRASRVRGAAQTRSLAYQAAGVARFGTTKAAILNVLSAPTNLPVAVHTRGCAS